MQRFYKPVLLRWRHPQKQGDSFPDWWLLKGRHQNGLGHPNLNGIGIYVKCDGYSLGWQKHGFARVDLIAFHVRSAEVLRDGLGRKLCLTDVPKVSRQVYGLTCRQDQMRSGDSRSIWLHRKDESPSDPSAWKWLKMASRKESFPV